MNNNFEQLKNEVCEVIESKLSGNEKTVINFINTILSKFNSSLTVRKNLSIGSFKTLLNNSSSAEEFQNYLNRLDSNKEYEINSLQDINEAYEFNEEYTKGYEKNVQGYEEYKKFLDSRIQFNENLFIIEYPKQE
jgi:hypothetical protein